MTQRQTAVSIDKDAFLINGAPTYPGRRFQGRKVEGLLLNARMVQGIFDDLNPSTRGRWNYPDGPWDAERNTNEFIAAMPSWHQAGLRAVTLNLQGGSPEGYSAEQPWHNSAFAADGALRPDYLGRLLRVLDAADHLGMVVILGLFYFGQDRRLGDEGAVVHAALAITDWLVAQAYTHVLVEIANEVDVPRYTHAILKAERGHELIALVQERSEGKLATPAGRLLVSTSLRGGSLPTEPIIKAADFLLLHGNHVEDPAQIRQMVRDCRAMRAYRGQPILFNEDDHFDFGAPDNHLLAALEEYAGWGYFDYRMAGESFREGFQSVPVDWSIGSERKRGFFRLLAEITGKA
jgi:hypothetical protein